MDSRALERWRCCDVAKFNWQAGEIRRVGRDGESLADSYREAYEPGDPTAVSVYSNARRTRKHPLVARRIAELQVKLMPGPEDMKALYQHALAVGLELTVVGEDDKVRLRAASGLRARP